MMHPVQLGGVCITPSTMTATSTTVVGLIALLLKGLKLLPYKSSSAVSSKQPLSLAKNFSLVQNFIDINTAKL